MLSTSQRSITLITLILLSYSSIPIFANSHSSGYFSDQGDYSYSDITKTFPKKKSETPSLFGTCFAVVCVASAFCLGCAIFSGVFNQSDESFLRDCENRYYDIANGYGRILYGAISNDDLEDHINSRFRYATYRILSYNRQLTTDINQISNDRNGVEQRIRSLAKKLQTFDEDASGNYSIMRSTKKALEKLYEQQVILLEQLWALQRRVNRLPGYAREEKAKRKEERHQELINALNRPQIHVHDHYCDYGHHCRRTSSVSVIVH